MRNRYSVLLLIAGLIIIIWVIAHLDSKVRRVQPTEHALTKSH